MKDNKEISKPRKQRRRISLKVEEQLAKSKTRLKITELSYNECRLPPGMRHQVIEIRRELGIAGTIVPQSIKQIDSIYKYWSKNKKRLQPITVPTSLRNSNL